MIFQSQGSIFLFLLSYATLTLSCNSTNAKFISEVEKLEKAVIQSEQSLQTIDSARIGQFLRTSNENLEFLQQYTITDTIDKETAIVISDYAASRKSMRMFLENYADVKKEILYSKAQLDAMRTDLANNAMAEDKFTDYFGAESKSVEKLSELSRNILQWYESALKMYEIKRLPVEKIIDDRKKKLSQS